MSQDAQKEPTLQWDEDAFWDLQDRDDGDYKDGDDWYDVAQAAPAEPQQDESASTFSLDNAPAAWEEGEEIDDPAPDPDDLGIEEIVTTAPVVDETVVDEPVEEKESAAAPKAVALSPEQLAQRDKERSQSIDLGADLDDDDEDFDPQEWEPESWEEEDEEELAALAQQAREAEEAARAAEEAALAAEEAAAAAEAAAEEAEAAAAEAEEAAEVAAEAAEVAVEAAEAVEEAAKEVGAEVVEVAEEEVAALTESKESKETKATEEAEEAEEAPQPVATPSAKTYTDTPGGIFYKDPEWVQSFVGVKGMGFVFLFAFLVYAIFAGDRLGQQSPYPHFVYLADAALKGQWAFKDKARSWINNKALANDWAHVDELHVTKIDGKPLKGVQTVRGLWWYNRNAKKWVFVTGGGKQLNIKRADIRGKKKRLYFVSFPPMPAYLMAAPMWVLGKLGFDRIRYNDSLFSVFFAALAVLMMFLVLQLLSFKGYSPRSLYENLQLTMLFGFGSVFFFTSVQGTVWFTALVVGAFLSLAFLWFAIDGRWPFLAGVMVGAAFLTRPLLILLSIFFLLWTIRKEDKWISPFSGEAFGRLVTFALPVAVVLGGTMYFNMQRFGSPLEFGHTFLPAVFHRSLEYGLFHQHWVPRNFYAFFMLPPEFLSKYPYVRFNAHGMSMFLTTPALLFLFFTPQNKRSALFWSVIGVSVLIMVPHLFYQNTGWRTFGNRFSIDYLPFLIIGLAICGLHFRGLWRVALLWALAINALGAAVFNRMQDVFFKSWPYGSLDWIFKTFSW